MFSFQLRCIFKKTASHSCCTYMDNLSVCIVNQSVEDDVNALVTPDSNELLNSIKTIRRRHRQTMVDP